MYNDLLNFLKSEIDFFIEAEAKKDRMMNFIQNYNASYSSAITLSSNGVILLQDDANKWGLELRVYVRSCPPATVKSLGFTHNNAYRDNYSYRLNNNQIVEFLFSKGYRIGIN